MKKSIKLENLFANVHNQFIDFNFSYKIQYIVDLHENHVDLQKNILCIFFLRVVAEICDLNRSKIPKQKIHFQKSIVKRNI